MIKIIMVVALLASSTADGRAFQYKDNKADKIAYEMRYHWKSFKYRPKVEQRAPEVPIPASSWFFCSALITMVAAKRRK